MATVLFFQKRCRAAFGKTVGAALYACPHAPKGVSRLSRKKVGIMHIALIS